MGIPGSGGRRHLLTEERPKTTASGASPAVGSGTWVAGGLQKATSLWGGGCSPRRGQGPRAQDHLRSDPASRPALLPPCRWGAPARPAIKSQVPTSGAPASGFQRLPLRLRLRLRSRPGRHGRAPVLQGAHSLAPGPPVDLGEVRVRGREPAHLAAHNHRGTAALGRAGRAAWAFAAATQGDLPRASGVWGLPWASGEHTSPETQWCKSWSRKQNKSMS